MRQMNADVRKTLDWQHRQEIERRQLDLADRKAKTITTLPVLEKSKANNGTDPIMGLGEVTTDKQIAERRRMQRILSDKIRARAEEARLREERKKQEERQFLKHMQQ